MVEGRTCSSTDKQLGGDLKKDLPSQTNRKTQLKLLRMESPRSPTGAFAENCTTGRTVGCLPRTHHRRVKAPVPAAAAARLSLVMRYVRFYFRRKRSRIMVMVVGLTSDVYVFRSVLSTPPLAFVFGH
jgi:hypothetical protein